MGGWVVGKREGEEEGLRGEERRASLSCCARCLTGPGTGVGGQQKRRALRCRAPQRPRQPPQRLRARLQRGRRDPETKGGFASRPRCSRPAAAADTQQQVTQRIPHLPQATYQPPPPAPRLLPPARLLPLLTVEKAGPRRGARRSSRPFSATGAVATPSPALASLRWAGLASPPVVRPPGGSLTHAPLLIPPAPLPLFRSLSAAVTGAFIPHPSPL